MNNRSDTIDILRVLMAYIIVVYHSFLIGYNFIPGGGIATEFFFLVTGALMNRSLLKSKDISLWSYIKHKFGKIIVMFWFTSAMTLGVIWVSNYQGIKKCMGDVITSIFELLFLRMAGFAEQYYINPVAWYLSAIFLTTILIYPLARRYREACSKWIFPLITIGLCSFLIKEYGTVVTVSTNYTYFSLDLVKRAIAEICLGFSLYEVAIYISNQRWTRTGITVLRLMEIMGYASIIIASLFGLDQGYSIWILMLLSCSVAISFSGYGVSLKLRENKVRYLLSEFSLSVYLSHYYIVVLMGKINAIINFKPLQFLVVYLVLVTLVSALNITIVKQLKSLGVALRKVFICD